jgi:hypothetical protein
LALKAICAEQRSAAPASPLARSLLPVLSEARTIEIPNTRPHTIAINAQHAKQRRALCATQIAILAMNKYSGSVRGGTFGGQAALKIGDAIDWKETGMRPIKFMRSSVLLLAGIALGSLGIQHANAQAANSGSHAQGANPAVSAPPMVNSAPAPTPPPTVNSSSPYTVPQANETPVSPNTGAR